MLGVLRSWWFAAACLLAAAAVCAVAVLDHRNKQHRINEAQVDEYYCVHMGLRCGGPSWRTIEHRWQMRQYAYESALGVLVVGGLVSAGFAAYRRSERS